jgi:hypothetical protein
MPFAFTQFLNGVSQQDLVLFVVNDRIIIRQAIDELLLLINCTEQTE